MTQIAKETLGRDFSGNIDFSLPKMSSGQGTTLAANTAQTFTTPPNFNRAFFSYAVGTDVFVSFSGTAAVYGGSVATTTSELNPAIRQISMAGGESISVISPTASYVGIRYDIGQ